MKPADAVTCSNSPKSTVEFRTEPLPGEGFVIAYGQLDCSLGKLVVDHLPKEYWIAGVMSREAGMSVPIGADGVAHVDIPY